FLWESLIYWMNSWLWGNPLFLLKQKSLFNAFLPLFLNAFSRKAVGRWPAIGCITVVFASIVVALARGMIKSQFD
ncbi:MAG: hypothetical protein KBT28_08465, partial [Bacteroidales bacterium]|nr:hypothetical protein [Candidatus Colimorpha merdihippi]